MIIKKIETGYLRENCYILIKNNDCLVIDPGDESKKIIKEIKDLNVLKILVTHSHFDHVGALKDLKEKYKVEVLDYSNLKEKEYTIKDFCFEVIYNPGHSSDSISFLFKKDKILFSGDFVFKDTVGRCDLDTGNFSDMEKSIEKIKKYSDLVIYPGHGDKTTLEYEKSNNIYFQK